MAGNEFFIVAPMHLVDEGAVPLRCRVEVATERAIDERVDRVTVADEEAEVESIEQQGKNVLGSHALKALSGAVPALIQLFVIAHQSIETIGGRQLAPEFVNDCESFGPSLVAVAADHVRDKKLASRAKRSLHLIEKALQIDHVMQGLIGDDGVVFRHRDPVIQVVFNEVQMR